MNFLRSENVRFRTAYSRGLRPAQLQGREHGLGETLSDRPCPRAHEALSNGTDGIGMMAIRAPYKVHFAHDNKKKERT